MSGYGEQQAYGHEIDAEYKRQKEIVCEFCNNIYYYDIAKKAQTILASNGDYEGKYYNIDFKITSLNKEISKTEQKRDSWTTLRQSTKDRHSATLNGLIQQLASATDDKNSLIRLYDDYKNYVSTLPEFTSGFQEEASQLIIKRNTLSIDLFCFELKKCTILRNVIGRTDDSVPTATATATDTAIGGRKSKKRKSRKSSRKSRKSSRKSRKSSRKSRK